MRSNAFTCAGDLSGGTVHLLCRNKGRADEARTHIVEQSKNQVKIDILILTLLHSFFLVMASGIF